MYPKENRHPLTKFYTIQTTQSSMPKAIEARMKNAIFCQLSALKSQFEFQSNEIGYRFLGYCCRTIFGL